MVTPERNIKIWEDTRKTLEKELTKNYFSSNPNNLALKTGVVILKYLEDKIKDLKEYKNKLDCI